MLSSGEDAPALRSSRSALRLMRRERVERVLPRARGYRTTAAEARAYKRPAWIHLGSAPGGLGAYTATTAAARGWRGCGPRRGWAVRASRGGCVRRAAAAAARRLGARGACARGRCGRGPTVGRAGGWGGECSSVPVGGVLLAPSSVLPPLSSLLPRSLLPLPPLSSPPTPHPASAPFSRL